MEPESAQEGAVPYCSPQEFPAIHKVVLIFLTTPVGNISCERSLPSPMQCEDMDSVINDRRSIKWACYAINSARNRLYYHSKRDL